MDVANRNIRAEAYLKVSTALSGGLSTFLGISVIIGWYARHAVLVRVFDGLAAMQPNTAVAFVLCGAAILVGQHGARKLMAVLGVSAGLFGLVTVIERLGAFDLRINQLLAEHRAGDFATDLGQMAPFTGICFSLAGIAFAIGHNAERSRLRAALMGILGAVIFGVGTVAFSGYLTGLTGAYAWGQFSGMALHTAFGFMILGSGIVASGWLAATGAATASPRWIPILVSAAGLTATIILWQVFHASEQLKIEQVVRNEAINVHNQIASNVNSTLFDFLRWESHWATHWAHLYAMPPKELNDEAALLIQSIRGLRAIGWVDPDSRLRWVVPKEENADLIGTDLSLDSRHKLAMETARLEGMALAEASNAPADDSYFIYAPISRDRGVGGFLVGIFHAREMLNDMIEDEAYIGYSIAVYEGNREIYRRRRSDTRYQNWAQQSLASFGSVTWMVRVWPKPVAMSALQSPADLIALLIGIVSTVLFAAVSYFAQTARLRAVALQSSNRQLEREVSERRRAEEELRDSEAQYRELFDKAGDSISLISRDGKFVAVNPGFESISGFAASDWTGRRFTEIVHKEDLPRILGDFKRLLCSEAVPNFELRFMTKSGEYRIGEVSASTRYRRGEVVGVMAIVRDVTERKRAHEQLELQLQRISALREINLATTSTLDLRSVLDVLVETIQRLLPYSALVVLLSDRETGELKRAACLNLDEKEWVGTKLTNIPQLVRTAMEQGAPVVVTDIQNDPRTFDRAFYQRNGLISYLGVPLVTKTETLGVMIFLTRERHDFNDDEVTFLSSLANQAAVAIQNSQLYEKIQRQAAELDNANKSQADFTAMIAHDLRSPLSNIIGISEMMHQGLFGDANDEQKNWLDRMKNNAKNLVDLVSDFLDVSKLESGRIELARAATNVFELATKAVENYSPAATRKNISLTCTGDRLTPVIDADARRLDQVLTNLLTNALKFTSEGGKIEIRVTHDADAVQVSVKDTGVGIPSAEISNLFQKYRQASSALASEHKGTGLGLLICKMIIEAHGGKIWVESDADQGATFHFTLPIEKTLGQRVNGQANEFPGAVLRS